MTTCVFADLCKLTDFVFIFYFYFHFWFNPTSTTMGIFVVNAYVHLINHTFYVHIFLLLRPAGSHQSCQSMSRTITCNSVQCYGEGESFPLPTPRGDSGILAPGHDFLLKSALIVKCTQKFPKHNITLYPLVTRRGNRSKEENMFYYYSSMI